MPKRSSKVCGPIAEAAICSICKLVVIDGIACNYCKQWLHPLCIDMNDDVFAYFSSKPNQKFFCDACSPKIDRLLAMERRIEDFDTRFSKLEGKFDNLLTTAGVSGPRGGNPAIAPDKNSFPVSTSAIPEAVEKRLIRLENALTKASSLSGKIGEVEKMVAQIDQSQSKSMPSADIDRMLLKDEFEREAKRKNAVLFGLPVSDVNDTVVLKKLISDANLDNLKPEHIITVFRDGPTHDNYPRFCKVYCVDVGAKVNFINFINESRRSNDTNFKNFRARPDLSYLQRKRGRELREELNKRIASGETNLFIDYKTDCIKTRKRYI